MTLLAEISDRPGTARTHVESAINNRLERSPVALRSVNEFPRTLASGPSSRTTKSVHIK